jgi:UDP-glucose 4-epimerase
LIVGDVDDGALVSRIIQEHRITAIAHFAAKIVVPESIADPLAYYHNNTTKSRNLLDQAVRHDVPHFIFSSTAAVYGEGSDQPIGEDEPQSPVSPYGRSKLMVEWILADTAKAYPLTYVILRYFNVAGADPKGRMGQSTPRATHLIKRAVQTALGEHPQMEIFGTDYPTVDGSCIRDFVQVTDLVHAHVQALTYLRNQGANLVCNCGYGHGRSVLEVIDVVKRVSGIDFKVVRSGRRAGDPATIVARSDRIKATLGWQPRYDNLEQIVRQALDWERRLYNRRDHPQ